MCARPVGLSFPQAVWVRLDCQQTGVGQFHLYMHKWGLAPSPNCKNSIPEQIADNVLIMCPMHQAPHGAQSPPHGVLDDKT